MNRWHKLKALIKYNCIGVFIFLLSSCGTKLIYDSTSFPAPSIQESNILNHVYLIGDVGDDTASSKVTLKALQRELEKNNKKQSAVIFLGDNIYPEGLHPKEHSLRAQDEARINAQLDAVSGFEGEVVFIPGNHDWKKGKEEGFEYIKRQEDYIQGTYGGKIFEPSDGCVGPDDIELSDALTIILIDTQWLLHKYEKGIGEKDDCKHSSREGFLEAFEELLKKNKEKNVIVAGHHPLYSNGVHGGNYQLKDHLFPLTNLNKNLWIPLPLIGSIYPFYRSYFGNIQDLANPRYRAMSDDLLKAMHEYENITYVAGHEHNLQYTTENQLHHIVSGSGSKVTNLRFNQKLEFGAEEKGFSKIEIAADGSVYLKFFTANGLDQPIFHRKIYHKKIREFGAINTARKKSYAGQYQTVIADSTFAASKLKRSFFGHLNRDLWTTQIKVPYLDIHYTHGGLQPIEKGGGMQTVSLKMIGGDGKEYKLRKVKKSALYLVSKELRGTIAQDVIYDGLGGNHPYASLVVPKIAEAVNIYYIKPTLVYVPKDSILGDYMDEFGGSLCLLEVHPEDDMSTYSNMGNSLEVLNYKDAIEELEDDQKNQVDVAYAVRARLLDMLLGDWDRHDDQWRWATFKEEDKTIFRPIPRDRDEVFFKFDGLVMNIANRKWLLRKFQPFEDNVRDIAGLNYNARYFDRYYLNEADRGVWLKEAQSIQNLLSDSVIEEAMRDLPEAVYAYHGKELIEILKIRRSKLLEFAERYYSILSKKVDIHGSLDKDYFEINRLENGDVELSIYPRKKGKKVKDKQSFYRRFKYEETKEIRIFGLDDKDEYKVHGTADKSILVRIIAGDDKDKIEDNSIVKAWGNKTKVYEIEGKLDIEKSKETKVEVKPESDAYQFNRKEFVYDLVMPIPSIGYNVNDGILIGPGLQYTKQGFKKFPYASKHEMYVNYAFKAEGINFNYENDFIELIGGVDFGVNLSVNMPQVYQFYGQGNETTKNDLELVDRQVNLNNYQLASRFSYSSDDLSSRLSAGINYQLIEVKDFPKTVIATAPSENQEFLELGLNYTYTNVDQKVNPSRGLNFSANASHLRSTLNTEVELFRLASSLSLFFPINYFRKQTTLAIRTGVKTNIGDYNFYQANFLSGISEFRGIERNRYAGRTASYSNVELRKSFFKVKNYIVPFDLGLIAHIDMGRVWVENDTSNLWHHSYGGGVFINILDYLALVGTYSISDIDQLVNVGTKFYF